jgi:GAF domain-containing protein
MLAAPIPADEDIRLAALYKLDLLDSKNEPRFERLTKLASLIFDVPIAAVNLVDRNRQWMKAACGVPQGLETARETGFCAHVAGTGAPLIVEDARHDVRFADNPFVTGEFGLRFYAGAPLFAANGQPVGALCLVDTTRPHHFDATKLLILTQLAEVVAAELGRPAP